MATDLIRLYRRDMQVDFYDEPADFLARASAFLAADPIRLSVLATNAVRSAAVPPAPVAWPRWFATISEHEGIVGVAMRTHPADEHPVWVGPMPAAAVEALGAALLARREPVAAITGSLPEVADLAQAMATATGGLAEEQVPTRLWALQQVRWPAQPPGRTREATVDDAELLWALLATFMPAAAAQAGRRLHPSERTRATVQEVRDGITAGRRYLLREVDGQVVHLTGINVPAFGTARIGPVLTPEVFRGNGYAAWVVASAAQQILDAGQRPCLYTDVTNPVSNAVYARIGFVALGDSAQVSVRPR